MPDITATMVKNLREKTGAGMMDCKKALVESAGDIEKAVEFLRKAGIAKAAKKAGRETKEGKISSYVNEKSAAMVELGSLIMANRRFLAQRWAEAKRGERDNATMRESVGRVP